MRKILLWAIPLAYLLLANTTIQKLTGLSTLDAYIVYKIGFAILLLVGVILTRTTREVGTSLNLNIGVIRYLWLFGVFACVQIGVNGFNVDSIMFIKYLVLAIAIGVIEEVVFRGILFSMLKGRSKIKIVLISASVFASIHFVNFFGGMSPWFVALQVFAAFSIGLMLGVARIKDTTIWMVVIAHTLINFSTFVSVGLGNPELNTAEVLMWVIPSLAFFLMGVLSLKDLRKPQTAEGR
jgi:membrane protease YdiL (CAAX protease family)